jgi:hypothetical protein
MRSAGTLVLFFGLFGANILLSQTVHLGLNYAINSTYLLTGSASFTSSDTAYAYTGGRGGGFSGTLYFDDGGMYHKRIYGIKLETNFMLHAQVLKIYPGDGPADIDSFYAYKTSLKYTDIPLMFVFCPSHHQGFTLEIGPQISFFRGGNLREREITVRDPSKVSIPVYSNAIYRKQTFSALLGLGLMYNVTENLTFCATFRTGIGLGDLGKQIVSGSIHQPVRRFWWGLNLQGAYKINKYYAKRNRGSAYYLRKMRRGG